ELLARVRALSHRRHDTPSETADDHSDLVLDAPGRRILAHDRTVDLTRREFDLLELFLRHPHQALTREQIHDALWSHDVTPNSGIVEVYVGRVRRKLENAGSSTRIINVRGLGYRLMFPEEPS